MTIWKRLTLFPALILTALVASAGDWQIALGAGMALGVLQFLKSKKATGFLDLFDRSTLAFGVAAGLPLGYNVAERAGAGETILKSLLHVVVGPAGAALLIVFAASIWVRAELIRQSQRKSFLS